MKSVAQAIRRIRRRPGSILVAALVCLFIAVFLSASFVKQVLAAHRQLLVQRRQVQAVWMAEAGVQRALAQLESRADYAGETWRAAVGDPAAVDPSSKDLAEVAIRVERPADLPRHWRIVVEAQFPLDSDLRTMHRKEILVPAPDSGGSS